MECVLMGQSLFDICSMCNENKKVASRNPTLCFNCYGKTNKEECNICCKIKTVNTRNKDGYSICEECNTNMYGLCSLCGEYKRIHFSNEENKFCGACRSKETKEVCSICNNLRQVTVRNEDKPVCGECGRQKDVCCVCGKFKKIKSKQNGSTCEACWKNSKIGTCGQCKNEKPLNNTINGIKVCGDCYHKNRKAMCNKCNEIKIIAIKDKEGYLCHWCYHRQRMNTDIAYKIKYLLRKRFKEAIKDFLLTGKVENSSKYINYEQCFSYLGEPPNDGEYHIDHIFPLKAFNFTNDLEIKIAWCPENLRWLKAEDNLKKGAKYNIEEFEKFKEKMKAKLDI